MTLIALSWSRLFSGIIPCFMALDAFAVHNLLFLKFLLVFEITDTARRFGKKIMAQIAILQLLLVKMMGKRYCGHGAGWNLNIFSPHVLIFRLNAQVKRDKPNPAYNRQNNDNFFHTPSLRINRILHTPGLWMSPCL